MSFAGVLQQFAANIPPWFLRNRYASTFLQAHGLVVDNAVESTALGLHLSQPLRCDESALPILSQDRGIRLYSTEPKASQRFRLSQWWQLHRQFGTHQGEMRNVQPFFLPQTPMLRIVHQSGDGSSSTWHTLDASGAYSVHRSTPSNWNWDNVPSKWSRFWLIVYTGALNLPPQPRWDGGQLWDGGSIWDGLLTSSQIADIVAGVTDAKSAHSQLWGVILAPSTGSFTPTDTIATHPDGWSNLPNGKWGFAIDNQTGKPTRLPGATFAYDLGQG
jgi:hypothetical protein